MIDLAVNGDFDLIIRNGDLATDLTLKTSMFVSLLTDRRAEKTDILPCNYTNMRGYVGDAIDNIRIGSRIWLLEDANNTSKIRGMVKAYAEESLRWLIDDGLAKEINIDVSQKCDIIELIVSICRHDGSFFNELFSV